MTEKESPFACDMRAIAPEQRGAQVATIQKLFRSVQSKRELPDGYAFELPNESDVLLTAAEFISLERSELQHANAVLHQLDTDARGTLSIT